MKRWNEVGRKVRKVRPDPELARSILSMIRVRLKALELLEGRDEFASILVEGWYEVGKEGITGLMAVAGYKTLSHEALVAYLDQFVPGFSEDDVALVDRLRKMRNKIAYKGFFVPQSFVKRNGPRLRDLVARIMAALEDVLDE